MQIISKTQPFDMQASFCVLFGATFGEKITREEYTIDWSQYFFYTLIIYRYAN